MAATFSRPLPNWPQSAKSYRIVDDQIGAPTSAAFIADILAKVLEWQSEDLPKTFHMLNHCLHLTAAGQTSWHGFATAIVSGLKRRGATVITRRVVPISTADYPAKALRPLNSRLNITRLQSVLQIVPPDWHDLLEAELDCMASGSG